MSKTWATVITVIEAVICAIVYYVAVPAVTLASGGFWWFLLLCLLCAAASVTMFTIDDFEWPTRIAWISVAAVLVLFIILGIGSTNMFHAYQAYSVADVTMSEISTSDAFPDMAETENLKNLPLVDLDTARMLGDKKIAKLKNASWYDVDNEYNLIQYQGKYYRLSVVDYGGFFKYNKANTKGLPGYVLVEVTPENGAITQEAKLVELEQPIRYSPGAFWSFDLKRHLRGQYHSYIFDKSFLEIDEEGTPYWVTGVMRPTAGAFGVKVVTSFILTNAQTGESEEYKVKDAPEWIDHIYSLDYLMTIAEWHYAYEGGFWNSLFSKTGVLCTSYSYRDSSSKSNDSEAGRFANFFGYSSIVSKDGEVLFYTGLTAANNAESNLGWLTIDASSGKMTQYEVIGAEESSAQAAVEQLVQANRYEATFPLPVNIGGYDSYIMCLKGKAGLTQAFAICNVDNYSIAVQAETIDSAISKYLARMNGTSYDDPTIDPTPARDNTPDDGNRSEETLSKSGAITEVYEASIGGTTYFYYLIDGNLYRASILINQQQVTYKAGQNVDLTYYANDKGGFYEIASIKKAN